MPLISNPGFSMSASQNSINAQFISVSSRSLPLVILPDQQHHRLLRLESRCPGSRAVSVSKPSRSFLLAPFIAPPSPVIMHPHLRGPCQKHENVNLPHVDFAFPLSWDSWLSTMSRGECGEIFTSHSQEIHNPSSLSLGHASYLLAMAPLPCISRLPLVLLSHL